MAQPPLTPNSMVALAAGDVDLRPVVQILDVKQIGTNQNVQERYRLVLSDGTGIQQAMLATQLNDVVKSGRLVKGSIVRLQEYICNTVKERKIVIVLNLDILVTNAELVGEPKEGTGAGMDLAANIQQVPPPQQPQQQIPSMQHVPPPAQQFQPPQQPVQYQSPPRPQYQPPPLVPSAPAPAPAPFVQQQQPSPASVPFVQQQQPSGYAASASYAGAPPAVNSTYGRPISSSVPQQMPASYTNRGPIARNEGPPGIIPIAALNPYHGRWTIKARITSKSEIRRYNNAKGEGRVFNFDLLDADGGEIRVTCFNMACDKFYDLARVGQVYMVSKALLKAASKAFNPLKNEWEIMFDKDSVLEPVPEDSTVPQQVYDFKSIGEIEALPNNAMVDVIAVVVAVNQTSTIMRKNGTETQKRSLQLKDMSGKMMELTLWGNFCNREGQQLQELFDSGQSPVLAIKGGRVSDFSGKAVGSISSSQFHIEPDLPEAQSVRLWFEREGRHAPAQSISREGGASGGRIDSRKTICQIKDENLGRSDKADFISIRATIHFIKTDTFSYTACPLPLADRKCHKKVTNNGDGTWRCERCDQSVPECEHRYMLSIQVMDHTGSTWLTAFQEPGEELMGVPAKDLFMWKQEDNGRFLDHIASIQFTQHHFKLKVKEESFNDEQRVKLTVLKTERCDFAAESKYLLEMIGKLQRGEPIYQTVTSQAPTNAYGGASTSAYGTGAGAAYETGTYGGSYSMQPPANNANSTGFTSNRYGGGNQGASYGGASQAGGGFMNSAPPAYGANTGRVSTGYSGSVGGYGGGYGTGGGVDSGSSGYGGGGGGGSGYGGSSAYNSSAGRGYGSGGGYGNNASGGGNCYKCGQPGHWSRDCTNQGAGRGSYGGF